MWGYVHLLTPYFEASGFSTRGCHRCQHSLNISSDTNVRSRSQCRAGSRSEFYTCRNCKVLTIIRDLHNIKDSIASVERLFAPPPDAKENKKKKKRSSLPSAEAEREETLPIDEIIDVQIGFLEASSTYSRAIATTSFSFLTGEVRRSTIDHILTVSCRVLGPGMREYY